MPSWVDGLEPEYQPRFDKLPEDFKPLIEALPKHRQADFLTAFYWQREYAQKEEVLYNKWQEASSFVARLKQMWNDLKTDKKYQDSSAEATATYADYRDQYFEVKRINAHVLDIIKKLLEYQEVPRK